MAPIIKKMTIEELSERRKQGLCFHYYDRYTLGHICKKLYMIEASWECEDDDVVMEIEEGDDKTEPKIS